MISTDIDKKMEDFQSKISEGRSSIKYIELQYDQLLQLKSQIDNSIGKEQESETSSKINKISSDVQIKQASMKGIIDSLEQMIKEEQDEDNAETRMKKNLFDSMIKNYQDICIKFQKLETDVKNIMQTKNIRAAENILGRGLSDNEKSQVINDPKFVEQIYGDKLKGGAHVELQNAIADLEERHKDIKNLENVNIQKAKNYVQKGEKNLNKAKENMKKARKKKCIILIIAIVILLIVVISIITIFT